jgi:hypothetical protein
MMEFPMKTLITAALLLSAASFATFAAAGPMKPDKPADDVVTSAPMTTLPPVAPTPDARTLASDQDVGEARRAYRAACQRHESAGFCECVTAGVSQALMPAEVRIAARTIARKAPPRVSAKWNPTTPILARNSVASFRPEPAPRARLAATASRSPPNRR